MLGTGVVFLCLIPVDFFLMACGLFVTVIVNGLDYVQDSESEDCSIHSPNLYGHCIGIGFLTLFPLALACALLWTIGVGIYWAIIECRDAFAKEAEMQITSV